jgi:hypothetical protein
LEEREEPVKNEGLEHGKLMTWFDGGLQEPAVLWDETKKKFRMWYEANTSLAPTLAERIGTKKGWTQIFGYAESEDGIHWKKYDKNPVFWASREEFTTGHTNVVKDPTLGGYHLFYAAGGYATSIYHAYSEDGLTNWQRNPRNPIIKSNLSPEWIRKWNKIYSGHELSRKAPPPADAVVFGGPSFLIDKDGRYRLYYMHSKEGVINFSGEFRIGLHMGRCDAGVDDPERKNGDSEKAPPEVITLQLQYEDLELRCLGTGGKREFVIRTAKEYEELIQNSPDLHPEPARYCADYKFPEINWQRFTLLGVSSAVSGCKTETQKAVFRDDFRKQILYKVRVSGIGACEKANPGNHVILVDKVPSDYEVIFELQEE